MAKKKDPFEEIMDILDEYEEGVDPEKPTPCCPSD